MSPLKMMKNSSFLTLFLLIIGLCLHAQQPVKEYLYNNPVIPGDLPDPTIIRVGNTYYAAGTTSDFAPHYPIYESTDLINWKQAGAAFYETPEWASDSFWAPELYYHNGTFYIFYTAKRKGDRISCIGVATTKNIHDGFTDQGILIEWGNEAIDAFVFKDDDDKLYIFWKAYGLDKSRPIEILGSELSDDLMSLKGDHFSVTNYIEGWQGHGDEGQSIFKKDGMYYMLYSNGGCCDNRCDYRVLVARSKNLKTGWEQLPDPILEGGGEWLCTGHGTPVVTPDNRWFYMFHSYHAVDFEYIGRQALLEELVWDEKTGWPHFKNGTNASTEAPVPFDNTVQERETEYYDDFSAGKYFKNWQWDINKMKPEHRRRKGRLTLSSQDDGYIFTGISPKTGNFTFEAGVNPKRNMQSGICIYGNRNNILALTVKGNSLVVFAVINGEEKNLTEKNIIAGKKLALRIDAVDGRYISFQYSENGEDWQAFDAAPDQGTDGSFLPQWGSAVRTGLIFDSNDKGKATYRYVRMENKFR